MSRALDIAYAAGLFEGEGSVHGRKGHGARAAVSMSDREPLVRLQETFGGNLRGPYRRKGAKACHKALYVWALCGWDPVEELFRQLAPWLSPRRTKQFERALADAPPPGERFTAPGQRQAAKTHCPHGHSYDAENTLVVSKANGRTQRFCRRCSRDKQRRRRAAARRAA